MVRFRGITHCVGSLNRNFVPSFSRLAENICRLTERERVSIRTLYLFCSVFFVKDIAAAWWCLNVVDVRSFPRTSTVQVSISR